MAGGQSIDGLASNLNTTQIVQAIMNVERQGVNLMQADKTAKTNQMAVYNAINAKLIALKVQASQLARVNTFDSAKTTVSDDKYLAAAVKGKISQGQYNIAIERLALNHQLASQGYASETASIGTGTVTVQVGEGNSTTITIDSNSGTLTGLKDAINESGAKVKAAIINDGSSSNPYRLLLTADETGAKSEIVLTSSLTGGTIPDFVNVAFDQPETLRKNSSSTAAISLGSSAAYTGSINKTYTFTVQGTGTQTIGSADITVNWTDGTNTGSITIPQTYVLGTEVNLTGTGADGLKLAFSAGSLTAGDSFQVQTFAPELQKAQDARISMGNTSGAGSPITVTSATNTISDLIPGVTLSLKKVSDTENPYITVETTVNTDDIIAKVESFVNSYNDVLKEIDKQFKYDKDTKEAGALFGDSTLLNIQNRLKSTTLTNLKNVKGNIKLLSQLGVRYSSLGQLNIIDRSALEEAISENLDGVTNFFTNTANSTNSLISFSSATTKTIMPKSGFEVKITGAAEKGYFRGTSIGNPTLSPLVIGDYNYKLKFKVDGVVSNEITLTKKTYNSLAEIAAELQNKINLDAKIGSANVAVSYMDLGDTGYLQITSPTYGSNSRIEIQAGIDNAAFIPLGLANGQVVEGEDVEGMINGEPADGTGQILTGKRGNHYSDGLALKVELRNADLMTGADTATLTLVKGFGTQMDELLDMYSATGEGVLANRANAIQKQIDNIDGSIAREEARLKIRETSLQQQYYALEQSLSQWNTTSAFLTSQLGSLSSNWNWSNSSSSASS